VEKRSVYEYLDYRELLKALYEERKGEKSTFSYRFIALKCDCTSAGFFPNVITGKRNITETIAFKLAECFHLDKKETEYFITLVKYSQADSHERRRYWFEELLAMRKSKASPISADQYEYFSAWYNVAIRELLNFYPFRGDFNALAAQLTPKIAPADAKKSVELLLRLGLVTEQEDHTLRPTDKTITTVPMVPLVAVHNFQKQALDLAKESIDRFPRDSRSISTLTLSLSEKTYKDIEEKLSKFRADVLDMVKNDQGEIDRVCQFNFQIYPFSQKKS